MRSFFPSSLNIHRFQSQPQATALIDPDEDEDQLLAMASDALDALEQAAYADSSHHPPISRVESTPQPLSAVQPPFPQRSCVTMATGGRNTPSALATCMLQAGRGCVSEGRKTVDKSGANVKQAPAMNYGGKGGADVERGGGVRLAPPLMAGMYGQRAEPPQPFSHNSSGALPSNPFPSIGLHHTRPTPSCAQSGGSAAPAMSTVEMDPDTLIMSSQTLGRVAEREDEDPPEGCELRRKLFVCLVCICALSLYISVCIRVCTRPRLPFFVNVC